MRNRQFPSRILLLGALGTLLCLTGSGCTPPPPPANPNPSNDIAGLGSPQERLKALEANTMMPEPLKRKKIQILQAEINNTAITPGRGNP